MVKNKITFFVFVILLILIVGCVKEGERRISEDFNVIYEYEMEKRINLKENKYVIGGICYPKTEFNMPFSEEEKSEIYLEIVDQNLINFNWSYASNILREAGITCLLPTTSGTLFSLKVNINNISNEIIWDKSECCCNTTTINDPLILKIMNQTQNLVRLSKEIESIINKKITELNISLPEPNPNCGYI